MVVTYILHREHATLKDICYPNTTPKIHFKHDQWSGRFLGITGWNPSVCKSNRLHVHILRFSFVGSISRQRLCINFSMSRVNFLTTLRSHLNVSCYFWSSLLSVDVNYNYVLSFYSSGYLKCIEKDLGNYTYFDNCWLLNY